jgi:hypothetical protein
MTQLLETPKPSAARAPAADAPSPAIGLLEKKRDFRPHLAFYASVNSFLWLVWSIALPLGGPLFPWPLLPLLGWGIGLAFHAWTRTGASRSVWRRSNGRCRAVDRWQCRVEEVHDD